MNTIAAKTGIRLASFQKVVDDRLVRGSCVTSPFRLYKMKKDGINQIIDLRNTSYIKRPVERFLCQMMGIKYLNYRYSYRKTALPSGDFFEKVNDTIIKNDGITYIHCAHGKRRTGVCVAVYEKFHTPKKDKDILADMVKLGFWEITENKNTSKEHKIKNIYNNLIDRFFPGLERINL